MLVNAHPNQGGAYSIGSNALCWWRRLTLFLKRTLLVAVMEAKMEVGKTVKVYNAERIMDKRQS